MGILGIDFLRKHRLMVIPVSNEIQEMDSKTTVKFQVPVKQHKSTLTVEAKTGEMVTNRLLDLLRKVSGIDTTSRLY